MGRAIVEISLAEELRPIEQDVMDLRKRVAALETVRADDVLAYSPAQAAAKVGVSLRIVNTNIQHGKLLARKMGSRVLIPRASLIDWLDKLPLAGRG